MELCKAEPISAIRALPGLYISDVTIPRSKELLCEHKITHVLSLTDQKYLPRIDEVLSIKHLHLAIDDNPFEDLLMSLEGLCVWIDNAIATAHEPRVLVHCVEGRSRSGAIVVALLMRSHSLEYEEALALAQLSRRVITPNSGFADQLRLWKIMEYSILEMDHVGKWTTKLQYEEWKASRGVLYTKDEEMKQEATRKRMADMVIELRQRVLERDHDNGEGGLSK
ncbi:phosphatases II [Cucurbitaria berberidis CBS 394.84]|uniref:protein-tyrosine-phosphatase n=1 Tax=Cucurbitaria berberidis CBS 394.84 TaxID=1168544 RepID=A0A9P4GIL6_9PLEO|nr:phosphatases II [Cucurbitaria berberidis CBS 394.84]KAF1846858.1 phosphatases II [Cucurbitaria berberidis CBS 394.84]